MESAAIGRAAQIAIVRSCRSAIPRLTPANAFRTAPAKAEGKTAAADEVGFAGSSQRAVTACASARRAPSSAKRRAAIGNVARTTIVLRTRSAIPRHTPAYASPIATARPAAPTIVVDHAEVARPSKRASTGYAPVHRASFARTAPAMSVAKQRIVWLLTEAMPSAGAASSIPAGISAGSVLTVCAASRVKMFSAIASSAG
jgi:hypothetical protein